MMKYLFILLWIISIFILYAQSQTALEQLPDLVRHKSEMMPKGKLLGIIYGAAIILNALFAGIAVFLSRLSGESLLIFLNVPNKDYWLDTPERLQKAKTRMSCGLIWFCLLTNGIIWYIVDLIMRSESAGASQPISGAFIVMILAGFFAGIIYNYFAFRE